MYVLELTNQRYVLGTAVDITNQRSQQAFASPSGGFGAGERILARLARAEKIKKDLAIRMRD